MGNPLDTNDSDIPPRSASAAPAADVVVTAGNVGPIVHQSFPVRQPEEDANEIMVGIRGRVLRRIRTRLEGVATPPFPWPEVLIGLATLCLGGFLGALASSLPWAAVNGSTADPTFRAILFYALLPMVGAASLVGFYSVRHIAGKNASDVALSVLEDLPDPDHTL